MQGDIKLAVDDFERFNSVEDNSQIYKKTMNLLIFGEIAKKYHWWWWLFSLDMLI